MGIGDDFAYVT